MSDKRAELGDELRLLAETVLERIEPTLRGVAIGHDREPWTDCGWCPVCAMTALVRGEQHELVTALAEHGTAMVTILREALAGVPVAPRYPAGLDDESTESAQPGVTADDRHANGEPAPVDHPKFVTIPVTVKN